MQPRLMATIVLCLLASAAIGHGQENDPGATNRRAKPGAAVSAKSRSTARKFYLTRDSFNGSQVLSACAKGYHLAGYWEIYPPSSLVYDTKLGFRYASYQFGPPSGIAGWIDPGVEPNNQDNCLGWTVDTGAQGAYANIGALPNNITDCGQTLPVWCVANP